MSRDRTAEGGGKLPAGCFFAARAAFLARRRMMYADNLALFSPLSLWDVVVFKSVGVKRQCVSRRHSTLLSLTRCFDTRVERL